MTHTLRPTPHRLEMRGISIAFSGFAALTQVDFALEGGSIHALTGANGAGKSTLMAVLSGAHEHYQGTIVIDGEPVEIRAPRQAKQLGIHLVQQEVDVALVPGLSVAENIMLDQLAEPGHTYRFRQLSRSVQHHQHSTLDCDRHSDRHWRLYLTHGGWIRSVRWFHGITGKRLGHFTVCLARIWHHRSDSGDVAAVYTCRPV